MRSVYKSEDFVKQSMAELINASQIFGDKP